MKITNNFSLEELTKSETAERKGVKNVLTDEARRALVDLCENVLQPIRDRYGYPLTITSGYRSPDVNVLVGGSRTSQHIKGEAADFYSRGRNLRELFNFVASMIRSGEIEVGQLIYEGKRGIIHVSLPNGVHNGEIFAHGTSRYQ